MVVVMLHMMRMLIIIICKINVPYVMSGAGQLHGESDGDTEQMVY